ncbi:protein indeterminate-domain 2 [Selaginella moellendorffii]|uniref:protein indeterminate-domain 2 n=1 Tax=Selaginella moellendorffii TaxID=88036 RepID=UPI000D1C5886|nr:protein indeterminate-domain 2 [Selaginella moellendorffii]|eukprot:XP_002974495.2 protein indeterminate-domain 2 [Selaginella moellendorffii]
MLHCQNLLVPDHQAPAMASPAAQDPSWWQTPGLEAANLPCRGYNFRGAGFHSSTRDHDYQQQQQYHGLQQLNKHQHGQDVECLSNLTTSASTAGDSSPGDVYQSNHRHHQQHLMVASLQAAATASSAAAAAAAYKRKRSLPGTPDPEAEVIALSPKTLMATNRFICEICNKGFQRDQNLQLHRRGHNLPWKLRQRSSKDVRKRVYVCPEPSCVHHDPSRALGDLTGIKKHFCRKHGEKKWKCDKCSKKYAVQSDWKAHCKTCGTREYRCDCGTLFSRRDSFITHRAFCDALAEESARISAAQKQQAEAQQAQPDAASSGVSCLSSQQSLLNHNTAGGNESLCDSVVSKSIGSDSSPPQTTESHHWPATASTGLSLWTSAPGSKQDQQQLECHDHEEQQLLLLKSLVAEQHSGNVHGGGGGGYLTSILSVSNNSNSNSSSGGTMTTSATELASSQRGLNSSNSNSSLISLSSAANTQLLCSHSHFPGSTTAAMSATALLLKASQMGATTSNLSAARPAGLDSSSSSPSTSSTTAAYSLWQAAMNESTIANSVEHSKSFNSGDQFHGLTDQMVMFSDHHHQPHQQQQHGSFNPNSSSVDTTFTHDFLGVGAAHKEFAATLTTLASGVV